LQILKEMHEGTKPPDISGWTILSFFHNDEAMENTGILVAPDIPIDPLILLREKYKDLERISAYPFISTDNRKPVYLQRNHHCKYANTFVSVKKRVVFNEGKSKMSRHSPVACTAPAGTSTEASFLAFCCKYPTKSITSPKYCGGSSSIFLII
jgi:hypothetical protein